MDTHIANLNHENAALKALKDNLISIPTDPKYLANKEYRIGITKARNHVCILRSLQEYSQNYTIEILKSIDKYKSQ